jgi:hypothetical protein
MAWRRRAPQGLPLDETYGWTELPALVRALVEGGDHRPLAAALAAGPTAREREVAVVVAREQLVPCPALDAWVEAEGDTSALPWTVRGFTGLTAAWAARGKGWTDTVTDEGWDGFFHWLPLAQADLQRAVEVDPTDPVPWTGLIRAARGLQLGQDEAEARHAGGAGHDLGFLDDELLQSLAGKWGGSRERSLAFARRVRDEAPPGSPRHRAVLIAHLEHLWGLDREGIIDYCLHSEMAGEVRDVAERTLAHPDLPDDVHGRITLSYLAYAAHAVDLDQIARACHDRLGTRIPPVPWSTMADPAGVLARHRRAVGLRTPVPWTPG